MVSIYVQPTSLAIDKYPAPDKERAQLLWVAHMNGLKAQAEEVVVRKVVYAERNHDSSCLIHPSMVWGDKMAYLKLMMDEKEIAHLSEDGQSLCANEDVPQYNLPLNLFIGDKRKVPLVDVVVWAKKRIFPKNRMDCKEILKLMGLPDYNAWEIVKRTNACLMEDPYWLRFSEDETFEDTTRGRARRIMNENQKNS